MLPTILRVCNTYEWEQFRCPKVQRLHSHLTSQEHADIREKLAQFRQPPPLAFGAPGQRHLQLQQALESQQISERRLSLHQNPMMAEPDTPHHYHTSHPPPSHHPHQQPSHPHTNGLLDQNEQVMTCFVTKTFGPYVLRSHCLSTAADSCS